MFRINFWVFLCILYSTSSLVVAADFLNVTDVQSFRLMCKNHMTSPFLDFIKREHYLRLVNTGNADESYLEGMTLNSADFKSKTLSFKKACLRNVVFIGSFQNADFTGVDLRSSDLSRTDFSGANFDEAHLINCNLSNGNFSGTTFRHACLDGSYGESVIMKNANFESASLIAVFWSGDTNGSSLKDANVELMQKTAAVFKAKCIDPDFCMYMRQLKEPGRIVLNTIRKIQSPIMICA